MGRREGPRRKAASDRPEERPAVGPRGAAVRRALLTLSAATAMLMALPAVALARTARWQVGWASVAWVGGFGIALVLVILVWVRQYRSTRHPPGIFPVDTWAGYTAEVAGPATIAFFILTLIVVAFGAEFVI